MASSKYQLLKQEAVDDSHEDGAVLVEKASLTRARKIACALAITLILAIASNVFVYVQLSRTRVLVDTQSFVGLQRNVPTPIPHDNRTIDDPMWDAPEFNTFVGMVALSDEVTENWGLLKAQRFPWDHSKGIYVFHGYHTLHCVFVVRQALMEFHDAKPQTWHFGHVTHCLHVLREDATCNADDLPRYTGALNAEAGHPTASSGTGEVRMCRDWSQLREFALKHSACYRYPQDRHVPLLDRYKFCPDGNKPWMEQEGL